ncbi:MAG TPA: hypothetical protein VJJ23_05640 [Candidatus Nanoarchaeia archaeon]|nr:hypothetical protein [Candidatus Pacearchaeota archaeon]HLC56691.1 hypothetical protein [Candidatus Nanoarchaeia archaeon]
MGREEFEKYTVEQRAKVDEAYSNGEIDGATKNRLYEIIGETERRYEEIRISQTNNEVQLERLKRTNIKLEGALSNLSLQATTTLFDLECTLKELR